MDSTPDHELATRVHRSAMTLTRRLRATRPSGALSASKLMVLGILQRKGKATAAEVAADLQIQPQSLTRLLFSLEEDQVIRRWKNENDRRQILMELTAKGREALADDMRGQREQLATALHAHLTPAEQQILHVAAGLMDQVAARLERTDDQAIASEPGSLESA